jgi:UDP-GlcNAc:undecaprenyl-phosphate GlcNAc-1-phosphate transferase
MSIKDLNFYILFFFGSAIISLVINMMLLRFSQTLGIRNKNDITVRWSNTSKPSLGGISLFSGFLFSTVLFMILDPEPNVFSNTSFVGLFLSGSLAFIMGLSDDAYNTKPIFKLIVQIICGVTLIFTNTSIDLFHIKLIDYPLTVVWVIILMNSLNMLDNMDGITGTTVFFVLLSCLLCCYFIGNSNEPYWIFTIVSMLGALVGFLRYNINPSKMFMGDAGSQFIGLFVAFFTIKYLWNLGSITQNHSWVSLIITLTALTPAAADTLTVVINRIKAGKSPMVGGKDHTTHHLVYAGLTDRQVWYIFSSIGFISFVLSVSIIYLVRHNSVYFTPIFLIFFSFVFYLLYRNTIRYPQPSKESKKL